jgi:hypothetical protein
MLSTVKVTYQLATETSPGEIREVAIGDHIRVDSAMTTLKHLV